MGILQRRRFEGAMRNTSPYRKQAASMRRRYTAADIRITYGTALALAESASEVVVVIDVVRAFTTACVLFAQGAEEIVCLRDAADAAALSGTVMVVGESETETNIPDVIPNSPTVVARHDLTARRIGLFTLNGTRALCQAFPGQPVLAAAGVNAGATARWIMTRTGGSPIRLVVSDPDGPEDLACARYLAGELTGEQVDSGTTSREIISAKRAHWDRWGSRTTPDYWRLFEADVDICARVDSLPIVMVAESPVRSHPSLRPVRRRQNRKAP